MDSTSAVIIFLIAFIIYVIMKALKPTGEIDKIPGPKGWPIIGNLLQIPSNAGIAHIQFTEWAKEFGPIFKMKLGGKPVVLANDLDSIHEVLVTKGKQYAGRVKSYRKKFSFDGELGITGGDLTPLVATSRKVVISSIKAFGSGKDRIEQLALHVTRDMLDEFQNTSGKPTDPKDGLYSATLKILSLMTFGESFRKGSESYINVMQAGEELIKGTGNDFSGMLLETFPWVRYIGNTAFSHLQKANKHRSKLWKMEVLDKLHNWELDSFTDDTHLPIAQSFFAFENQRNGNLTFTDTHKQAACMQVFLGGVFTTLNSMLALLNILVQYPDVQAKLHREIDSVLGERRVDLNDKSVLPFTCATILELHRYASVNPLSIRHVALQQTSLMGYKIPQKTRVIANFWALHHDEKFWPEPFRFKPERFLEEDGKLVAADHPNRKHVLPFGAGPRVCPGEVLAQGRIFLWATSILQRFELRPDENSPVVPCDPREYCPNGPLLHEAYKICFLPRT